MANEIVVEVQLRQVGAVFQAFNFLDLVERKYDCLQLGQVLQPMYLLNLVVEEVEVGDVLQVLLLAQVADDALVHAVELTSHRDVRWHVLLDDSFRVVLVFNELVVVFEELFDMELDHDLKEILFEAAHVGAVEVTSCQMDLMMLWVLSLLGVSDIRVF